MSRDLPAGQSAPRASSGESMIQAVTVALRERLSRLERRSKGGSPAGQIMEIGADCGRA